MNPTANPNSFVIDGKYIKNINYLQHTADLLCYLNNTDRFEIMRLLHQFQAN